MPTNGVPTLQDLIARSGVDPSFFGEFGATEFGGQLGLKGEQLSGFKKFANMMKFDPNRIEDLLSSIGEYGKEQTGFVQEQYGRGEEALRAGAFGQMAGARQQTGGFAGSGAQQRSMSLLGQQARTRYGELGGARQRGLAGLQEQMESRIGQTQGLLGDYISRLTQLGQQFLSYDPGGGGDPPKDTEVIPIEVTKIPTIYSGDMVNVNGIMYRWNPDTKQYELAEGDPSTLPNGDGDPGSSDIVDVSA